MVIFSHFLLFGIFEFEALWKTKMKTFPLVTKIIITVNIKDPLLETKTLLQPINYDHQVTQNGVIQYQIRRVFSLVVDLNADF